MIQTSRKTAPEALAPIPFNIPKPFKTTLDNGLRVVIFEDKRLPLVSYRLAFFSGEVHDPSDAPGLTSAMASMLTEGTENYSSRALAEKIERLGAAVSASSSSDFTSIAASSLALYSSDILGLMSEILFRPTFPDGELDLYKRNTVEHLKFQRSQPNFLAGEQTARMLYGEHPYSRVSPTAADVENLSSEKLAEFHRARLIPNNAVFIGIGDLDRDELLGEIEKHFGDWSPGDVPGIAFPELPHPRSASLVIVDRPGSAQANIVLANIAIARNDPDYFPVVVMNQVLGAGASSRIFMNLREEKGYTYGAYSRIDARKLTGDLEATAEVRTAVTGDSLREFFYELNRIRDDDVAESELADAKNFLTGVFPIRAETQEGLTGLIVSQELYDLPDDYLQSYRENIGAVTAEQVRKAANKYIRPAEMCIVIVGDAVDILSQAKSYSADVEIYDAHGAKKELADFAADAASPADVSGEWKLSLDFQGQQVPVSLSIQQDGSTIRGELETMLGIGKIEAGKVKGAKFTASASTEMQGSAVEFVISGSVDSDSMTGTITAPIVPEPLVFTGTRRSA